MATPRAPGGRGKQRFARRAGGLAGLARDDGQRPDADADLRFRGGWRGRQRRVGGAGRTQAGGCRAWRFGRCGLWLLWCGFGGFRRSCGLVAGRWLQGCRQRFRATGKRFRRGRCRLGLRRFRCRGRVQLQPLCGGGKAFGIGGQGRCFGCGRSGSRSDRRGGAKAGQHHARGDRRGRLCGLARLCGLCRGAGALARRGGRLGQGFPFRRGIFGMRWAGWLRLGCGDLWRRFAGWGGVRLFRRRGGRDGFGRRRGRRVAPCRGRG